MNNSYPSDWDSRRKQVYRRDNYTCQNCGAKGGEFGNEDLHAHHIVPKSKGGTHQISNLVCVCSQCHNAIHHDHIAPTGRSYSRSQTTQNNPPKRRSNTQDQTTANSVTLARHFSHYFELDRPQRITQFNLFHVALPVFDDVAGEILAAEYNETSRSIHSTTKYSYLDDTIKNRILAGKPKAEREFDVFPYVFKDGVEDFFQKLWTFEDELESPGSVNTLLDDMASLSGQKPPSFQCFLNSSEKMIEATQDFYEYWNGIIQIEDGEIEISYEPSEKWRRQELIEIYEDTHKEWSEAYEQLSSEVDNPTYLD